MESFDRELYLKQLEMYYSGDSDCLEQFLLDMSDSLDCYLEEHPAAAAEDIYHHFGHPEELRAEYEAAKQQCQLHQKQNTKRKVFLLCFVASLAAGILCLAGVLYYVKNHTGDVVGTANNSLYISAPDETLSPTETPQCTSKNHTEY
jgi:hypothetical protein